MAVVVLAILVRAGFGQGESIRLLQVLTGMLLGPAIHSATYAAARRETPLTSPATPATRAGEGTTLEPPTGTPEIQDWVSGADADRITIDLWVSGVEAPTGVSPIRETSREPLTSVPPRPVTRGRNPDAANHHPDHQGW